MPRQLSKKKTTAAVLSAVVMLAAGLAGCQRTESTAQLLTEAEQYEQKGDQKAALIQLKNAVAQSPDDGEARVRLGNLHLDMGDAVSAEKELRKAASLGIKPERTLPLLGKALQAQGEFKKMLDDIPADAAKASPVLLTLRGDAHLALGEAAPAREAYEQALALDQNTGMALTGLARTAFMQRDNEAAKRYTAQAVERDPKNAEVWMFQGAMLRAEGKPDAALAAFDKALALAPRHRTAHLEKAAIEIGQGKFPAARASLEAARKIAPGTMIVTYTQALLDFSEGKFPAAQENLQKVLKGAPGHMPSVLLAGAVELNLGATQQAELHLRKYLEAYPNNTYARKLLAQALLKNSQPAEAAAALAPALAVPTQDAQLLALAGESYLQAREFDKASAYFEKATALAPKAAVLHTSLGLARLNQGDHDKAVSELQLAADLDPKSSAAGFALVEAELNAKRFDKALAAVQKLEQRQPDNAQVHNLKGKVYAARGDVPAARAAFDKALALQPAYFTAVANQAQLDLVEKKPEAAKKRFEAFLAKDSKNFGAMAALSELAMLQGKPDEATTWLEKASNANPDAVAPALKLGVHYLGTKQPQKALTLARKFQATHPSNPDLLDLLGQAQVANKDAAGALETYSKLVSVLPKSALAQLRLAGVHAMLKNEAAAADDLKRAVELDPKLAAARIAQVELAMRRGRGDEALSYARALQKLDQQAATGLMLEGDLLMTQKKFAQALPAYQKAYAARPSAQLVVKTAEAMRQSGKAAEARQLVAQWQKAHPDDAVVALYTAEAHLGQKEYKSAIEILQGVLKKDPNNPVALNNLAWAYQQEKDPRALATAEHALKVSGNSPAVMDTLGWLLVEQGNTARGVALLQKASALAPDAPDIRYHLAYALSKAGDKAAARKELDQLLAAKLPSALQEEARSLRSTL